MAHACTMVSGTDEAASASKKKRALRHEKDESTLAGILGAIHAEIQRLNVASGHPELIQRIRDEISVHGSLSFARFMELALYDPNYGYYASGRARIGRGGDFFTNVSVGSTFACLMAAQLAEIWQELGKPSLFTIVEHGAHDGAFAADALAALARFRRDCFDATHYVIAEPFSIWRERQKARLAGLHQKVRWITAVSDLEPFVGVHFSNELFDAFPVHLITSGGTEENADEWREKRVAIRHDDFEFITEPICGHAFQAQIERLPLLRRGFETEINLAAPDLMPAVAGKLSQGVILTIDYGFPRAEFYSPRRDRGTLQMRSRHRKHSSPFQEIGHADISAHVEWTSLAEAGEAAGAILLGFADQHHFFTGIISGPAADIISDLNKRALQTLLHPELLGRSFQVLALAKNFDASLGGFRFARDSRAMLGLATSTEQIRR